MIGTKMLGLVAAAALAAAAFVGVSSASAAQWLDNGNPISSAEAASIDGTTDGGLTLAHSGGLGGNRSLTCVGSSAGTVGPGSGDVTSSVTTTSCVDNDGNCSGGTATAADLPWTTTLVSTTEDDLSADSAGDPGWTLHCGGLSGTCTKATTPTAVANDPGTTPETVTVTFNQASTGSDTCGIIGGTGTVDGTIRASLDNGDDLSVG